VTIEEIAPEGDPHRKAKEGSLDALRRFFERIGRRMNGRIRTGTDALVARLKQRGAEGTAAQPNRGSPRPHARLLSYADVHEGTAPQPGVCGGHEKPPPKHEVRWSAPVKAVYRMNRESRDASDEFASLSCILSLDGSRFWLSVTAVAPAPDPPWTGRREDWSYAGEWSRRESELVFRPATCESQVWQELEVLSAEMAMMDQPFFKAHATPGKFSARVLDTVRLLLPVPGEMMDRGGFKYTEVVLAKE
jgi:hypothetical protein